MISGHLVLLRRAPSLNRSGIQAFQPVITAGNVIRIHPLLFQGFDSELDGDQVTVQLPHSHEAQRETLTRMMPANSLSSPANGDPVFSPSQDIVMGCYYVTLSKPDWNRSPQLGDGMIFASTQEVHIAYELGKVAMVAKVKLRLPKDKRIQVENDRRSSRGGTIETTVGRILFNEILPWQMAFYNQTLKQKDLEVIVADCHRELGPCMAIGLMERITQFGLRELTSSGCSIAVSDLIIAKDKATLIAEAEKQTVKFNRLYDRGLFSQSERRNQVLDVWQSANHAIRASTFASLENDERATIHPLLLMCRSGAGIRLTQILHFSGMLGGVLKPSGEHLEIPVKSNFREGLSIAEYFISSVMPSRYRLDSWRKSRRSRFLARKLVRACRQIVVTKHDCGATEEMKAGSNFPIRIAIDLKNGHFSLIATTVTLPTKLGGSKNEP